MQSYLGNEKKWEELQHSGKWKNAIEVYQGEDMPDFLDRFLLMRAVFLDKENAIDRISFGL